MARLSDTKPQSKQIEDFDIVLDANKKLVSGRITLPPTDTTLYRISSLSRLCARQEVICGLHSISRREEVPDKLQRTFDMGNAFHSLVQNEWFGKWGWLWGDWSCGCGAEYSRSHRPAKCDSCGRADAMTYVELELENKEHGITGHPDGVIKRHGISKVMELKTASGKYYEYIVNFVRNAIDQHRDQVNMYMWMLGIRKGSIIYFNKSESDWVEFKQEYSQIRVDRQVEKVKEIRAGLRTRKIPPRTVCEKEDCARAKSCPVRKLCFELR